MNELQSYILGELSVAYYLAAGFFSSLAIIVSIYHHSLSRDKSSERTPEQFSWRFLLWDNTKRIGAGLILMFLFFRFSPEIFGKVLDMWQAVLIGLFLSFGVDKAIQFLRDKFNLFKTAQ